tara:strand:+ start:599 stop:2305 length:1707 start_codon:yes stop_codon:yes gene_type:complete
MGLLDNTTQNQYYEGSNLGNYQFTSLDDIINQFMVVYVGEEKIIGKASRTDVQFHAMRSLAELSFDTFKSIKSQEIVLPPSLTMMLPQDYVNYTKISFSDNSGIKHPLYPTRHTSNPFAIKQNDDGSYFFGNESERLTNFDFSQDLSEGSWVTSTPANSSAWDSIRTNPAGTKNYFNYIKDIINITSGELNFGQLWNNGFGVVGGSKSYGAWQRLDVSLDDVLELRASATSGARITADDGTLLCDYGVVRVGITSDDPSVGWQGEGLTPEIMERIDPDGVPGSGDEYNQGTGEYYRVTGQNVSAFSTKYPSPNYHTDFMNLGFLEWSDGSSSEKELLEVNVSAYDEVWIWVTSSSPWTAASVTNVTSGSNGSNPNTNPIAPTTSVNTTHQINKIDQVSVIIPGNLQVLSSANEDQNSRTWDAFKSNIPSENTQHDYDYDDHIFEANVGRRYGLDPAFAQDNGSFYIDELRGKINFSSSLSGSTIILDYISDSLGTDKEMQVHKLAEEAMYKSIMYAILSTRSNTPEYIVRRYKKERFAEIRKAKLRLSNVKLEEITQILRGKSKRIKH